MILVGGKGTRLRPLTLSAPKPMLPTAGLPFLTHLLSRVAAAGIEHVILSTSYKAAVFEAEFGDGSELGLQIDYVTEEHPLGTGGGIANVADKLRHDTVMVFNGDVLSGADLGQLLEFAPRQRSRRHPAPGARRRSARVRLRAHRREEPRHGLSGEDRGSAHRSDQRRHLCLRAQDHRPDSARPPGLGRARGVPVAAVGPGRQDLRLRRRHLLARHGHPGRLRARIGGPGARHRPIPGAAAAIAASSWCTKARRCRPVRC